MSKYSLLENLSLGDQEELTSIIEGQIEKRGISSAERQILCSEAQRLGIDETKLIQLIEDEINEIKAQDQIISQREKSLIDLINIYLEDDVITQSERKALYAKGRNIGYSQDEVDALITNAKEAKLASKGKFWYFLDRKLGIGKFEFIGLCFGIIVFVMSLLIQPEQPWLKRLFEGKKSSVDNLTWTTIVSFVLVAFFYIRGIMTFANGNKIGKWIAIIVNVSMIAGVMAYFASSFQNMISKPGNNLLMWGSLLFMVTMLLFGQRGMSKMAVLLSMIVFFSKAMFEFSNGLRFAGYIMDVSFFSSLFFQENIRFDELAREFAIAYGTQKDNLLTTMDQAADEMKSVGDIAKKAAVGAVSAASPAAGAIMSQALDIKTDDMSTISQSTADEQ